MKPLILLFLLISQLAISSSPSFAKIVYKTKNEELPLELRYLLLSLQTYQNTLQLEQDPYIRNLVQKLALNISMNNKAENFFIIKTEIYKAIFEIGPGQSFKSNKLTFETQLLLKKLNTIKSKVPFIYWMALSLMDDYKQFVVSKGINVVLITPWLNYFNENDLESYDSQIKNLLLQIIKRINSKYTLYNISKLESLTNQDSLPIKILHMTGKNKVVNVESIIDKAIRRKEVEQSISENSDFDFSSLSISELFPEPTPNYTEPKSLPKPVEEWK